MTRDDIQLLFEYDRWANNRVLQAAAALTTEQFTRDLGGSFPSVRDAIVHVIAGEWTWLAYWKATSHGSALLAELRKRREGLFNPNIFADAAAVRSKWEEVAKELADFVNELTNEALNKTLPARGTQIRLGHLMQHVANHSTYHRGQVPDDATARCRACGHGLPCVSGGRPPQPCVCRLEPPPVSE